ncbi:hypothetical protein HDZ31DRAFT_30002 [Schizophyllum fasciatum]
MSTTTQILFNSPALHSLKREQLVKLCKVHSLKANGKNTELIERLKQHARTLPKDAPLSVAASKDEEEKDSDGDEEEEEVDDNRVQGATCGEVRPVMERIDEVDEKTASSRGTMSSMRSTGTLSGEFGTKNSKASNSVGSSIKALASSLGLKRAMTSGSSKTSFKMSQSNASLKSIPAVPSVPKHVRDELLAHSRPYSAIPPPSPSSLPQTDHFTFDPALASNQSYNPSALTFATDVDPLPGHVLRPGQPAPEHARLSLGQGPATPSATKAPTTTLRLVSNAGGSSWEDDDLPKVGGVPATPQLKPFHTTYDLIMETPAVSSMYPSLKFSPEDEKKPAAAADEDVEMPGAFDSPTRDTSHSLSATSPTPEPFIFGSPNPKHRVSNAQFSDAAQSVFDEINKRLQAEGTQSIDSALLTKLRPGAHSGPVPIAPKSDREIKPLKRTSIGRKFDEAHNAEFEKMESIKDVADRRAAAAAKKEVTPPLGVAGRKRKSSVIDTEGAGPSKRPSRPSNTRVISSSRRNLPGAFGDDSDDDEERPAPQEETRAKKPRLSYAEVPQDPEEQARKEREREAVKRRLEANKARRRSSAGVKGRASIGKPTPKKPSRFGFFSAAKSVVSNVWNRGKTAAPPSNIPKPTVAVSKPAPVPKKPSLQPNMPPPSSVASKAQTARTSSSSKASDKDGDNTRASITSNGARTRSPIPPFGDTASKRNSAAMGSMGPPPVPTGSRTARNSSMSGASSMGARNSTGTNPGRVSSLGTKGTLGAEGSRSSIASRIPSVGSSSNRNSRLLAPTASSLAKQHAPASTASKLGSLPAVSHLPRPAGTPSKPALNSITNVTSPSPRPGGIFSSGIPMPSPPKPSTTALSPGRSPLSPGSAVLSPVLPPPGMARKPTITRKPRISRGRVIAKLASQRAAAQGAAAGATPGGKTRSSLGARVARQSLGAHVGARAGGPRASFGVGGAILMSAKKRARQSEYMRRKSRAAIGSDAMEVDG